MARTNPRKVHHPVSLRDSLFGRMRFSVHTAARVCTLLQRRPNTLVPGQRRAADEIRPERRKHYSAADHRRAAPSLRPDMIYDMDTGHEHEITSFKNRHSAGEARILHICREVFSLFCRLRNRCGKARRCVKPGQVTPYFVSHSLKLRCSMWGCFWEADLFRSVRLYRQDLSK